VRQIEIAYLVIIYLKFKPFCEDTGSVAICKLLIDAACVVVGGSKQLGMAHQYFFDEEDANLFCNALVRNELMRFIEGSNWYNEESRDAFLANTRFVFKLAFITISKCFFLISEEQNLLIVAISLLNMKYV
jgi:hypothetical protein